MPIRLYAIALLAAFATSAAAQQTVTVQGVAYDSVRGRVIANAFVTMAGRSGTTDSVGHFTLDSVRAGTHVISLQHESLDSIGLAGLSRRAVVTDGRETLRLSVPSYASIWRTACGRPAPVVDSGMVFGVVREIANDQPAAGVTVLASWLDVSVSKAAGLSQKRWNMTATTDSTGGFALCGVPLDLALQLRAARELATTDVIDQVIAPELPIQRRDLLLGLRADTVAAMFGSVAGTVSNEAGRPVADARVLMVDHAEVRTSSDGRFSIRGVASGTRQLEVLSLGTLPLIVPVDVRPNAVTDVALVISRGHTLDTVQVKATTVRQHVIAEIEDRRRTGFGRFVDSTRVNLQPRLLSVFEELPGVRVDHGVLLFYSGGAKKACQAPVWVDGMVINPKDVAIELQELNPKDIATIEIYQTGLNVPSKFQGQQKTDPRCGAIAIWTKRILR